MSDRTAFKVARFNPFWRYATACLERPDIAAIPYWSKASAMAFADEANAAFPHHTAVVLRRRWRHVEIVDSGGSPS